MLTLNLRDMRYLNLWIISIVIAGCNNPPPRSDKAVLNSYYMRLVSDTKPAQDSLLIYAQLLDSLADDRPEIEAMAASGYGIYYKLKGFYRQSYSQFMRSDSLAQITGNDTISVRALIGAGQCDWNEGRTDDAIEKNLQALRLAEKNNFYRGISGAHISLAQIYQQTEKTDLARNHLRAAMNLNNKNLRDRNYFIAAHTLANLYGMTGKLDSALAVDREMLLQLGVPNFQKFRSMFYDNQANCYSEQGLFDSSFACFKRSIAQDSLTGDARQQADSYLGLSNLFMVQQKIPEAEMYMNEFLRRARSINYKQGEKQAWQILATIYAGQQKYALALAAKDSVRKVSERLLNEKTQTRIAELQTVYETEKKDRQLADAQLLLNRQRLIIGVILIAAVLLLLLGISYYQRFRRRRRHELQTELQRQQQLATQALFAGEQQERLRIGRDLHDSIGQQLAVLKMQLSAQNGNETPLKLVEQTLKDVRTISHNLIPDALNFGIAAALDELCVQLSHSGVTATLHTAADLPRPLLKPDAELSLFRLAQEVTGNMLKYAEASTIELTLSCTETAVSLLITDNGRGFDTKLIETSEGRGWGNVQARTLMLGGTVRIESAPGNGTKLYLHIPR
jgi:two-component system, NarL family, sensor kinase